MVKVKYTNYHILPIYFSNKVFFIILLFQSKMGSNILQSINTFISTKTFEISANCVILIFLLLLIFPLYKLSKTRVVLMLIFSKVRKIGKLSHYNSHFSHFKTLVSAFTMLLQILIKLYFYQPKILPNVVYQIATSLQDIQYFSVRLHQLALAINRLQAVFFPIWYATFVKKK